MISPLARRRVAGFAAVLTVALTLAVPSAASAVTLEVEGGSAPDSAVPLPISDFDSSFTASNAGQTSSGTWSGQPFWNNVAWYSVTPSQNVRAYIRATSVSPAGWDNTLEVWTGGGSLVGQVDDAYGLDAAITVNLSAGTRYVIGLGGYWSGARGSATLTFASRTPSAPLDVAAVAGNGGATVSWTAPTDAAGGISEYRVYCTPEGGTEAQCAEVGGTPPATSVAVAGLANGTSYTARVVAQNFLGDGDYSSASAVFTPRGLAAVAISTSPAAPVSGEPFDLIVSVTSDGAAAGGVVDVEVGEIAHSGLALADGTVTIRGLTSAARDLAVSASYAGSVAVAPASAETSVTVSRRSQVVALAAFSGTPVYGSPAVVPVASSSEDLPVALTAVGACSLVAGSVEFTGVGACLLTATQAGTSEVLPASAVQEVEVGRRAQTLAVGALPVLVYGQATTVSAVSSVGLPVVLLATGACAIDGTVLRAIGVGECELTATQAGDVVTTAAESVLRSASIGKRPQTVTLTALPEMTFGLAPFGVTATSEFSLPVAVTASGACSFIEGSVVVIGSGRCTVTARAEGDEVTEPGTASTTGEVRGVPTNVDLGLGAGLGAQLAGSAGSASGVGLLPGSELILEAHSEPVELGRVTVGALGTATVNGVLPTLPAGDHELVALGTALDGSSARWALSFAVDESGRVVRLGTDSLTAAPSASAAPAPATAVLAQTGTDAGSLATLAGLWIALGVALVAYRVRSGRRLAAATVR